MATIRPFAGVRYATTAGRDVSDLVAPPYDVLDAAGKQRLLARSPFNVVEVDLPHVPPKAAGPAEAYARAAETMRKWLDAGVLVRDRRPAFYPYEQDYEHAGVRHARRGVLALVKLTPFGVDVIPHEQTYAGAIEDRLLLMRATGHQLSPVFGLFMDPRHQVLDALFKAVSPRPDATATLDGVTSKLWSVHDSEAERRAIDVMRDKKIYVADGHHRYTTALQYQAEQQKLNGGPLPDAHPANYCLFVLVNGDDPGLLVLPTHRVIGGLRGWDLAAFAKVVEPHFDVTPAAGDLAKSIAARGKHAIGLYDGAGREAVVLTPRDGELMKRLEPTKSEAWRSLDVAVVQRYLIEEVLAKQFAAGGELVRTYTPDAADAVRRVDRGEAQLAFVLQSTPTRALVDLGAVGETMPQKSTYFFPKLATGLVMAPLG